MRKLSRQKAYERVRAHFTQPGVEYGLDGKGADKNCAYRGNKDPKSPRRCAIGVLISNTAYPRVNEYDFADDALRKAGFDVEFDGLGRFAHDLQRVHDDCAMSRAGRTRLGTARYRALPMKSFIKRLDEFAAEHGLKVVTD
jgi:hypothetical protein